MTDDASSRRLTDAELVRIERSLAMSPSIPEPAASDLLGEVRRLRAERSATVDELAALVDRLRAAGGRI